MDNRTAEPLSGLSTLQAQERFAKDGPNELPRRAQRTALRIALEVLREPMLAMLLAAGLIYLLLGDTTEALILIVFAGLSIAITVVQETRSERVLEALGDMSAPRALVIRDGQTMRIAGREVVQGDLLVLDQGDRIAADGLLVTASGLEADESLLTGESVPVRKRAATSDDGETEEPGGEDRPQVYSGAMVTRGSGVARVTATGPRSRIGLIGKTLSMLETEAPRLQQETAKIVRICAIGGIGLALLVVLLSGLLRGDWLAALLSGIAVGMSMLPEEFPVVLTVFLAMGAWRIAQLSVLTRRASAIETMGATTVLCTDKTGTLTQNRMTVAALWLPSGETAKTGTAEIDGRFDDLLEAGALASAPVPIDPMEIAFHDAARDRGEGHDGRTLVHSNALRPDLLAMSNVWDSGSDGDDLLVAAKGAPEAIGTLCGLDAEALGKLHAAAQSMAEEGMRVIGIARAYARPSARTAAHEEHAFALLGLAGLSDPLRPGVVDAVAQCRSAGIRVVMITGDYAATARAIADEAGIVGGALLTGAEVSALSDSELALRVRSVSVFARTLPEQKLRIVMALKEAGEVVAMTGDGVNDAPALKAAHIGVAMGRRGTDVAREAAAIVLVDDDFGAIVAAIRTGRRIYDNISKAAGFIFGAHVPIAALALAPLLLGGPTVLGPIQIALLEMIIDPACALVFEAERDEHGLMQRPPRSPSARLFSIALVARGVIQGGLAAAVLVALYMVTHHLGLPPAALRTLVFYALAAAIFALILANRSFSTSLNRAIWRGNLTFRYVFLFLALGGGLILFVPQLRSMLGFAALGMGQLGLVVATGAALLVLFELTKLGARATRSP